MIRFRHCGCQSEVFRYVGQDVLLPGRQMRVAEWQTPDGRHPSPDAATPKCPDCGTQLSLSEKLPAARGGIERISELAEA